MPGARTAKTHMPRFRRDCLKLYTIVKRPVVKSIKMCQDKLHLIFTDRVRAWVSLCVITHRSGTLIKTYLPLLLLPGRIQQQVSVPVLLLGHIRLIVMDRVGVAVSHLSFDGCHHVASDRTG